MPTPCIDGPALEVAQCKGPVFLNEVKKATDELGNLTGYECNANLLKLRDKLRSYGLCAIGGEPGSDAVFIRRPDGLVEENHACYYGNGAWTGSGYGKFEGCHWDGPPQAVTCTAPQPPKVGKWNVKPHNRWFDSTPLVYGKDGYCKAVLGEDRVWCPARTDCPGFKCEERAACEALAVRGEPLWHCASGNPEVNPDNPYQARCEGGAAWIEVCSADGTVCQRQTI